jgi:predicted RNA-binding protein associated with RNAse of E/G family
MVSLLYIVLKGFKNMKRKFGDRANWRRVTKRQFRSKYVENDVFTGYVTYYHIISLRDPLWKTYGEHTFRIADQGYTWLQYYPKGEHYVVTSMFDDQGEIVEWYIDVCKHQGVTDQGVPWFDDLYLDIVVLNNRSLFLLDEDELDEALTKGMITVKDYDMATETAKHVLNMIKAHKFPYLDLSLEHYSSGYMNEGPFQSGG